MTNSDHSDIPVEANDQTLSPPPLTRADHLGYDDLSSLEVINALWELCENFPNRPATGWSSNFELINWLRHNLHYQLFGYPEADHFEENNGWGGDTTLYSCEHDCGWLGTYQEVLQHEHICNYGIDPISN